MLINEISTINLKNLEGDLAPFFDFISGGNALSFKSIADKLRRTLANAGLLTRVTFYKHDTIDSGDMNMNAVYDPDEDEQDEYAFEIDLLFSNNDSDITFSDAGVQNIKDRLIDVIKHEMTHQQQYRSRDFIDGRKGYVTNRGREIEYMSRPDEIEAYALNIADELKRHAGSSEKAIELLKSAGKTAGMKKLGYLLSPNLFAYFALFGFDTTHPVIKRLLKKTVAYLQLNDK